MKRTMLEIEYVREGEFQEFAWIDGIDQGEPLRFNTKTSPKRKRVSPHILDKTIAFLKRQCWSRVDYEGKSMPIRTLLPPATVTRIRKVTIEYSKWEER